MTCVVNVSGISQKPSKKIIKANQHWGKYMDGHHYYLRSRGKKQVHFNESISARYFEIIPEEMINRGRTLKGYKMINTSLNYPSSIRNMDLHSAVPFKIPSPI